MAVFSVSLFCGSKKKIRVRTHWSHPKTFHHFRDLVVFELFLYYYQIIIQYFLSLERTNHLSHAVSMLHHFHLKFLFAIS